MINFCLPSRPIFQPISFLAVSTTKAVSLCSIQNKVDVRWTFRTGSRKFSKFVGKQFSTDKKISATSDVQLLNELEAEAAPGSNDYHHHKEMIEESENNGGQSRVEENYELIFKEIADGDEEVEKQLKILAFEISIFRERYTNVPTSLKKKHWIKLLGKNNWSAKKQYLNFLFLNEKKNENSYEKKKNRINHRQLIRAKETENHHIPYSLKDNSMFLRIYTQSLIKLLQHRTMAALLYSQHLVFDCSYVNFMSDLNIQFCAKQILFAYSSNRLHTAPFHLKFCNFDKNDNLSNNLSQLLCCTPDSFPIDVDSRSFLDIYPKEKLVYLTPHCKEELNAFNFDDIYIIGAYVDRGTGKKLSLAKAKEMKIRMAKFPIDRYLNWQKGVKSLPLNIVLDILLDLRYYGKWPKAFKNIPARNTFV